MGDDALVSGKAMAAELGQAWTLEARKYVWDGTAEDEGPPPGVVSERKPRPDAGECENASSLSPGGGLGQGLESPRTLARTTAGRWWVGGWYFLLALEPRQSLAFLRDSTREASPRWPQAPSVPPRMLGRGDRLCTLIKALSPSLQPCLHGRQLQHPSVHHPSVCHRALCPHSILSSNT